MTIEYGGPGYVVLDGDGWGRRWVATEDIEDHHPDLVETLAYRRAVGALRCTHPTGRAFPNPIVRQMLRALGVVTCPRCYQALRILGRSK